MDAIERPYSEFLARTSAIRRWMMLACEDEPGHFGSELAANSRAFSLVWVCATSEIFWKDFLEALCAGFAQASWRSQRRKIRAQAIYFSDRMFSPAARDLNPRWQRSFDLLESMAKDDRRALPVSIPYDGKTVRARHFELLWLLFEVPGTPFPSLAHRQSLETLADDRNSVAHGDLAPSTVGRLRSKQDVMRSLSRLEETIEKCYVEVRSALSI